MRCSECGSLDIGFDRNNNRYCRQCGTVLEEVGSIEKKLEEKLDNIDKLDSEE
jgi:transcription initiation factor TFIIIB Brf1 subunit/transcription initiation factor TFIIB